MKNAPSNRYVVCLKWGTKYGPEYVNLLYKMVRRYLTLPHTFICITDDKSGLDKRIQIKHLDNAPTDISGWWYKLILFKENYLARHGTVLFLDLDIVIVDQLNDLFLLNPECPFMIIKDPGTEAEPYDRFNSSVMRFEINSLTQAWDLFIQNKDRIQALLHGDQDWLDLMVSNYNLFPDTYARSYKYHCGSKSKRWGTIGELLWQIGLIPSLKKSYIPEGSKIILFHGNPNPEDVRHKNCGRWRHAPWINKIYQEVESFDS